MLQLKALLLASLLLTTEVLAARITYSAKFHDGHKIPHTSKLGNVPDDKEQDILDNMAHWSDNKYSAKKSKHNMILVVNAEAAASRGKASEEIQEMQSIVHKHTK